jgi:hypothetical protein
MEYIRLTMESIGLTMRFLSLTMSEISSYTMEFYSHTLRFLKHIMTSRDTERRQGTSNTTHTPHNHTSKKHVQINTLINLRLADTMQMTCTHKNTQFIVTYSLHINSLLVLPKQPPDTYRPHSYP